MLSEELSIGEMIKLREELGSKKFTALTSAALSTTAETKEASKQPTAPVGKQKRVSKHHPREISSKRRVAALREAPSAAKRSTRDPRFDDLSGEFDETMFSSSYGFIGDIRSEEKTKLQTELKKCKDPARRDLIVKLINKINTSDKANKLKADKRQLLVADRRQALENVKRGKNPYFAKKSDLRTAELKGKFERLKKEGKVDKYLAKRRKRNLQKDKKSL